MFTVLTYAITHWHTFVPFHLHLRIPLSPIPLSQIRWPR